MGEQLLVVCRVFDMKTETCESERVINQYNHGHRQWLAKTCWWAMHNGKGVQTFAYKNAPVDEKADIVLPAWALVS